MASFGVEVSPEQVGFDSSRLDNIDQHLRRYVDDGRLPGYQLVVCRRDQVAHLSSYGMADIEAGRPVETDTLWRIYSMTKPVTSVGAMALYEQGRFELTDPVSRWLPEFASPQVYVGGPASNPATVPATEPIRIWHLLTHTAGLTYAFHRVHVTDEIYRLGGFDLSSPEGLDLAGVVQRWAQFPLAFQPGTEWLYSVATDVLGRLIEVVSGKSLDAFLAEHVLGPLGMTDTGFLVEPARHDRLAALYATTPQLAPDKMRYDTLGEGFKAPPQWLSGGGGLVSTSHDYLRFARMLLRGGELDGARVLSPRTVRYMARNHLPGGVDLAAFGRPLFAETRYDGIGFGLGLAVVDDPAAFKTISSAGECYWGGMASTAFWVDPTEDLVVVLMTQLLPSSIYPLRTQLRQLVHAAIVD